MGSARCPTQLAKSPVFLLTRPTKVSLRKNPDHRDGDSNHSCRRDRRSLNVEYGEVIDHGSRRQLTWENKADCVPQAKLGGNPGHRQNIECDGPAIARGDLVELLPNYRPDPVKSKLYALHPYQRFVPPKVRMLIDFLTERFGELSTLDQDCIEQLLKLKKRQPERSLLQPTTSLRVKTVSQRSVLKDPSTIHSLHRQQ